jgi:coniferyl-aldehyde dehydrogenase
VALSKQSRDADVLPCRQTEDDVEAFVARYDAAVRRFYPHGPTGVDYTAIVSDRHYARLASLVADAWRRGARVVEAGVRPASAATRARTLAPTVVVGAPPDSAFLQEKIFWPILPVCTYRTMADAIDYVNARPRPLALYYFGPEDAACAQVLRMTTSGNVGINHSLMHVAQDDLPSAASALILVSRAFVR